MHGSKYLWGDFKTLLINDHLQTNRTFVRSMEKICSYDVEV